MNDDRVEKELAELVKAVQSDEEAESDAHRRLLGRIDELCDRLEAVDAAVATVNSGDPMIQGVGVPAAELANKFEDIADRVVGTERRCGELQRQIKDKFDELSTTVARLTHSGSVGYISNEREDRCRYGA